MCKSRAWAPIAMAGCGEGWAGVVIMPKGMFERPKWFPVGIWSQEVIVRGMSMTELIMCDKSKYLQVSILKLEIEARSCAATVGPPTAQDGRITW